MQQKTGRLTGLDGVRTFAVGGVIIQHQGWTQSGWIGVWTFFVVSGFVITRSLLERQALNVGAWNEIKQFYIRRARRILPIYFVMVLIGALMLVAIHQVHLLSGLKLREGLLQIPSLVTGTFNFYRMSPSYSGNPFYGHLWSLSVEEQFYWLFPFAMFFLPRNYLVIFLLSLLLICPLIRAGVYLLAQSHGWNAKASGYAVYLFSPGQFDAFAVGCLLAIFERVLSRRILAVMWLVSAFVLIAYLETFGFQIPNLLLLKNAFTWEGLDAVHQMMLYTVVNIFSVALVSTSILTPGPLASLPLTFIGRRSYGIYVIHYPLIFVWNTAMSHIRIVQSNLLFQTLSFCGFLFLLILISHLSFTYFERPLWLHSKSK